MNKKRWLIVVLIAIIATAAIVIYTWPRHFSDLLGNAQITRLDLTVTNHDELWNGDLSRIYNITDTNLINEFMMVLDEFTFSHMIYLKLSNSIMSTQVFDDTIIYYIGLDIAPIGTGYTIFKLFTTSDHCSLVIKGKDRGLWFVDSKGLAASIDDFITKHQLKPKQDEPWAFY